MTIIHAVIQTIAPLLNSLREIDNSLRLLALEENWILCAIVIAVNAIWHSGMLLIVRYVLAVLCMLSLYIRVEVWIKDLNLSLSGAQTREIQDLSPA